MKIGRNDRETRCGRRGFLPTVSASVLAILTWGMAIGPAFGDDHGRSMTPLTDVAPSPPLVDVTAQESPVHLRQRLGPTTSDLGADRILPSHVMNERRPPQWTTLLAAPLADPQPPDPFTPPPILVDPRRVPDPPGLQRRKIGEP